MPGVAETVVSLVLMAAIAGAAVAARRRVRPALLPRGRPVEEIAADVRRISLRYHQEGMRFAQYEGRRKAYDQVLAEAADTLEIAHLLGVLGPGPELDGERERLEGVMSDVGVLPRPA